MLANRLSTLSLVFFCALAVSACGGKKDEPDAGYDAGWWWPGGGGGGGNRDSGVVCSGGTTECAGQCFDLNSDPNHCGTCTLKCGAGQVCVQGGCVATCGNSAQDPSEQCDDGNTQDGDGCSQSCQIETGYECSGTPSTCHTICGDGKAGGAETCDDGNTTPGDGCSATCATESGYACTGTPSTCAPVCGDGQKVGAETCDDGNANPNDGCSAACATESGYTCTGAPSTCKPTCGDGQAVGTETCDDGDAQGGDGCSATCQTETGYVCSGAPSVCGAVCGDGIIAGAETCDDGAKVPGDGCSATCTQETGFTCTGAPSVCTAICGNGLVSGTETCDDGNTTNGDGCSSACASESGYVCAGSPSVCAPVCGDGQKKGAESCDDGNTNPNDGCSAVCTTEAGFTCTGSPSVCAAICGDSQKKGPEQCDDGNVTNGDGCSNACAVESGFACTATSPSVCTAVCGDGQKKGAEACDDGNTNAGDGCGPTCAIEAGYVCSGTPSVCSAVCGDGQKKGPEQCDDGNTTANDGCSAVCVVEVGWSCTGSPSVCSAVCGDGKVRGAETCDDGNLNSNDGCSSTCASEGGWTCSGQPSVCATVCGDGQKKGAEACDDGNTTAGDGCSNSCAVESGYTCTSASPSVCSAICGDGQKKPSEGCDDGNTVANDGCSATCTVESGWTCTGQPSACATTCGDGIRAGAEQCDDGNATTGDCCNAQCLAEAGCEVEVNDTFAQANAWTSVSIAGKVKGFVNPKATDRDLFGLSVPANSQIVAETLDGPLGSVCSSNQVDTEVTLFSSAGTQLAKDDDSGAGFCSKITSGVLAAGSYFVDVHASPYMTTVNDYTLQVTVIIPVCGNGAVEGGERCDDGNTTAGDGCGATCQWETTPEVEPNDTTSTATPMVLGKLMAGALATTADADVYAFTLTATSDVEVETWDQYGPATCATVNTTAELLNSSGGPIALDYDSGVNLCSLITGSANSGAQHLPAGTYYVRVGGSTALGYTMRVRTTAVCGNGIKEGAEQCDGSANCTATCDIIPVCGNGALEGGETCDDGNVASNDGCSASCAVEARAEVEPNNNTTDADLRAQDATPFLITGTQRISGAISTVGDKDVFKLTVATQSVVRFETFGAQWGNCPSGLTTALTLFSGSLTQLVQDTTNGIQSCSALVYNLAPGSYYIQVGESGDNATIGAYLLDVTFETDGGAEVEPNDAQASANTNVGGNKDVYVFGGHQLNADEDWYAVTVPAGASIRAEVIEGSTLETCESLDVDSLLTLYDPAGTVLVSDDDAGRGYCSELDGTGSVPSDSAAHALAAGTYYIKVSASTYSSTGTAGQFDYRLVVTVRY